MKKVHVLYFAQLREQRGLAEEDLMTGAVSVSALYADLATRHGFSLGPARLRAVVNETFVPWETTLADGDSIAFIPPVAGG
jgi:molybdopterin converting factor subunit 1